jgi:hypothetical protein
MQLVRPCQEHLPGRLNALVVAGYRTLAGAGMRMWGEAASSRCDDMPGRD